jgi:hypothetical protein
VLLLLVNVPIGPWPVDNGHGENVFMFLLHFHVYIDAVISLFVGWHMNFRSRDAAN